MRTPTAPLPQATHPCCCGNSSHNEHECAAQNLMCSAVCVGVVWWVWCGAVRCDTQPTHRYVRHILVQTEEMAKMCLGQIREGADFGELASSISDCQATRAKGGEVDTHTSCSKQYVRCFPTPFHFVPCGGSSLLAQTGAHIKPRLITLPETTTKSFSVSRLHD